MAPPRRRTASLGVIFGIVVLDLLGFGILIPQLGVYGVKFHGSPFLVGLLLSVYSLMQLLFAPILGRLSDRHGRRPVLLISVAGSLVGYVLFAFSHSLELLFLSRVIDGISGANISTAQAYVADVTTAENRAKGMGMVGAAFGIGFLLGPGIGGFLGAFGGNLAIGLGAAALSGLNLLLAVFFLPESLHEGSARAPAKSLSGFFQRLKTPVTGALLLLMLAYTTAFSQMEGTFSVFVLTQHLARGAVKVGGNLFHLATDADEAVMRAASLKVGYLFAAIGLISVVIQGGLIGRLKARFGEPSLVVAGLLTSGLGIGLIPVAPTYAWFFVPVVLMSIGSALLTPSLSALMSLASPPERQGELLGAFQAMGSLGRIVGPATGGLLFTVVAPWAPYAISALVLAASAMLALTFRFEFRQGAVNR